MNAFHITVFFKVKKKLHWTELNMQGRLYLRVTIEVQTIAIEERHGTHLAEIRQESF